MADFDLKAFDAGASKTADSPASFLTDFDKNATKVGDSLASTPKAAASTADTPAPKRNKGFFRTSGEVIEDALNKTTPLNIAAKIPGAILHPIKTAEAAAPPAHPLEASGSKDTVPGLVRRAEGLTGNILGPMLGARLGGPLGAGAGAVASDIGAAEINKRFFGQKLDDSASNVALNEAINFGVNAGLDLIPFGASRVTGAKGLTDQAIEAEAKQAQHGEAVVARAKDTMELPRGTVDKVTREETEKATTAAEKADKQAAQAKFEQAQTDRQKAIQQSIGRTQEQTAQALDLPTEKTASGVSLLGQGTVQRKQDFYNSVYGPVSKMYDELGNKYEQTFAPFKANPVTDTKPMVDALQDEVSYATQNGVKYGPKVQKLIDQAASFAERSSGGGELPDKVTLNTGSAQTTFTLADVRAGKISEDVYRQYAKFVGDTKGFEPSKVGEWLGLRSQASAILKTAEGPDRAAAKNILDGIDDTLADTGVPRARELNTQYRATKDLFDRKFFRTIGTAHEPTDVLTTAFAQPDRFKLVWQNATDEQKSTLRTMYADAINRNGSKILTPEQRPILNQVFKGTPLADDANWVKLDAGMFRTEQALTADPVKAQDLAQNINRRLFEIRDEQAVKAVEQIKGDAYNMGPRGKSLLKLLNDNKANPVQAAEAAEKWYQTAPEGAAIASIQEGKSKGGFATTALHRLQWYVPMMAATTLAGHPSTWGAAGVAIGASAGIHLAMRKAIIAAAQNPETAAKFYKLMTKPTLQQASTMELARMIGDGIAAYTAGKIEDHFGTRLANQNSSPDQQSP